MCFFKGISLFYENVFPYKTTDSLVRYIQNVLPVFIKIFVKPIKTFWNISLTIYPLDVGKNAKKDKSKGMRICVTSTGT